MGQFHCRLWAHIVIICQEKSQNLQIDIRKKLINHLIDYAQTKDYYISSLNGGRDHLHCLLSFQAEPALKEIVNELKTESANWLNSNKGQQKKFAWQPGFAAFSVSESKIKQVRRYIAKQDDYHSKFSFQEEWQALLLKHNLIVKK